MNTSPRVLILEDDVDSRTLFREIFVDAGMEAVCADHDTLPEPDGFTVIVSDLPFARSVYSSALANDWVQLLRQRYLVPVIVVTGHAEASRDADLRRTAHVLPKPIDVGELIERVRMVDGVA